MQNRNIYVDVQRGILIILVVFGHAIDNVINGSWGESASNSFKIVHDIIYSFHMPAFFIISGMFSYKWVEKDFYTFLLGSVKKLVIPYFSWVIIVSIIKNMTTSIQKNPIRWIEALKSPIVPFEQYWFLYVLFCVEIIFFCLNKVISDTLGGYGILIISIIGVLVCLVIPDVWIIRLIIKYFFYYSFGNVIAKNRKECTTEQGIVNVILFILLSYLLITKINTIGNTLISYYYQYVIAIIGYFVLVLLSRVLLHCSFLSFFGRKSMEVFCCHAVLLGILRVIFERILHGNYLWLRTFVSTLICLICCYIVFSLWTSGRLYACLFGRTTKCKK